MNFISCFGLQPVAGVLKSSRCREFDFCGKKGKFPSDTFLHVYGLYRWAQKGMVFEQFWSQKAGL